jgi:hypothetical protein
MRPLTVVFDHDPETKVMWNAWSVRKATIKVPLLSVYFPHGTLLIDATDPQLVADLVFSHERKNDIVKGKLGVNSVAFLESEKDDHPHAKFRDTLKAFLGCDNE